MSSLGRQHRRGRTMPDMRITVIVADGLQVAALGPYGNEWIATPPLNRLPTQAVVFDQHVTDVPGGAWDRARHAFPPDEAAQVSIGPVELHTFDLRPPWNPPVELLAEQFED